MCHVFNHILQATEPLQVGFFFHKLKEKNLTLRNKSDRLIVDDTPPVESPAAVSCPPTHKRC